MRVQINGEIRELPEDITLDALVRQLALAPERLAIELNREVVRRARWAETLMRDGDQVEIVHFVGGGSGERCAPQS
ncbi:MAG: sulfur carrier protein [Pyrinomonadaceae bacterium]|nr:sulfur carrier protein [Pyrinomonadaceae bacterium]